MNQETENQNEVVLYIGTHKIVALEGSVGGTEPAITRHFILKNPEGFEKGFVSNLAQAAASIDAALNGLYKNARPEDLSCYVILGNPKLKTYGYSSSQYYQGLQRTITTQEIRQVVNQTRSVATLPLTEFVLQSIPQAFLVNDMEGIQNPEGLEAHRLGVYLKIYTMNFQEFKNISRAFEAAGVDVEGYFPKTLTASEAVLSAQEKSEGAVVIDIADESAHLILWKDGQLKETRVIPQGGGALTSKIAAQWGVEIRDAWKIKEQYASLEEQTQFDDELIPLIQRNGNGSHSIKKREFREKFLAQTKLWLEEILKQADDFAAEHKVLHPHTIFTGGGTSLEGFLEFLNKTFSRAGRIGLTKQVDAPSELLVDPSMTGALGIFRWLAGSGKDQRQFFAPRGFLQKTLASAKDWFTTYF